MISAGDFNKRGNQHNIIKNNEKRCTIKGQDLEVILRPVQSVAIVVIAVPPITTEKAKKMIQCIPVLWKNINGYRGKPLLDLDALIAAIVKMGNMAEVNYEEILGFEINPLRVRTKGKEVVALNVLASVKNSNSIKEDVLIS